MNLSGTGREGYYFSSACSIVGSFLLFFVDLHRRNLNRHKHLRANGTSQLCTSETCPQRRKLSFSQEPDNEPGLIMTGAALIGSELFIPQATEKLMDSAALNGGIEKPELTCISEEGIADMDLPDNLLDDLDYVGDCITSCNKVENYLMLSEFENNLNVDGQQNGQDRSQTERRRRKLSMLTNLHQRINEEQESADEEEQRGVNSSSGEGQDEGRTAEGHEGRGKGHSKRHLHWPHFGGHHSHNNNINAKGVKSSSNSSLNGGAGAGSGDAVSSLNGTNQQKRLVVVSSSSLDGKRSNYL